MATVRHVNLNHYARVRLTPKGVDRLREYWLEFGGRWEPALENGWYRDQLWQIMRIFGERMHLGMHQDMETEIVIEIP